MSNAALRGCKQDCVQGAMCVPVWATHLHTQIPMHVYPQAHTGTHVYRLTHIYTMSHVQPHSEGRGNALKASTW